MAAPNNPTFNRSSNQASGSSPGYYSRTMFSFVGQTNNLTGSLWTTGSGVSTNCNGISDLTSSYASNCWGSHVLPEKYWRDGKVVRARGTFFVSCSSANTYFNMRFGISTFSTSEDTLWLGVQNNNNNHIIRADLQIVNFENIIACSVADSGSSPKTIFVSNGFYSHTVEGNEESENRRRPVWTPIWSGSNEGFISQTSVYSQQTFIAMNLAGTNMTGSIQLLNLSLEELA